MPDAIAMTVAEFRHAVARGAILPGDCMSVAYGRRQSPLQALIERVQRRLLIDLWTGWAGKETDETDTIDWAIVQVRAEDYARFTHSRMVLCPVETAEMTSPRARVARWEDVLEPGDEIAITRPIDAGRPGLAAAASGMRWRCEGRPRYPYREIMSYYVWSWGFRKLARGERFGAVFASRRRDVCSGTIWRMWQDAGCLPPELGGHDDQPEAWYPARLACPGRYLAAVARIRIVETAQTKQEREVGMKAPVAWKFALFLVALVAILFTGCRGVSQGPEKQGTSNLKVYEINIAPNARSIVNIGNAGTQSPMYQAEEGATGETPGGATMPAEAGTNAVTAQGKYVLQGVNDAVQRSAEQDLATALTAANGLQQSQVGQTQPVGMRTGTGTGTQTLDSQPTQQESTILAPNVPVSAAPGAASSVTSPVAGPADGTASGGAPAPGGE